MRAAIYVRQSKDAQGTGAAVDRQRQDCERLCAARGWTIVETLTDNDISASNGKVRPGYRRVLELMDERAVDVIVAWQVDRLLRRMADLEELIERCESTGVRVATVGGDLDLSTDAGRLVGRILGAVARGEVERKSTRQKRAAVQSAERGLPPSRRGFGYSRHGELVPDEAAAVRQAYEQLLRGVGLGTIAVRLNADGHRTTRGHKWHRSDVRALLLNPRNAGKRTYRGTIVGAGNWPAIVDEDTWHATAHTLKDPARRQGSNGARRWVGSGLFLCGVCGDTVLTTYRDNGFRIYKCRKGAHLSRKADPVDELVEAAVVARVARDGLGALLEEDDEVAGLRHEADTLRARLDQLGADYADGHLTAGQVQIATRRIQERLDAVDGKIAAASRGRQLARLAGAPDISAAWADADIAEKRALVDAVCTVTLLSGSRGGVFRPDSVRIDWR
jgi:site-specific DNA recombinase